ncbi:MAG: DUF1330 domain-containing protein [Oscillatoriales cyanobacterium SM2_2_1]|nr:DUF1330 domain-containing protein [Oscillatoriales cyanobacterium SM2_2_1]
MPRFAYVIGHITVIDPEAWMEYRSRVAETLMPWGGELIFRGRKVAILSGAHSHPEVVVLRFPNVAAVESWFSSPDYSCK